MNEFPVEVDLLDVKILNILVERRRTGYKLGLKEVQLAKRLGMVPHWSRQHVGDIRKSLYGLRRGGWVETYKGSRIRWRATTKAVTRHGFAEGSQTNLERWL